MKTRNQIILICICLFVATFFLVTVYFYPEPFGLTKPYVIVRDGDYSIEGKEALDFFRQHVSSTCPYTPKPESANSYDPVDCIWQNTICPFEGNPKYKKFFDSKGELYVGLVDEFGSLITCDDIVIRMPESEPNLSDSLKIPNAKRDAKLAAGYKLYPGVGWVHPDDLGNQKPIYRDNPNNPGELILDLDAMIKNYASSSDVEILLIQNQIDYLQDMLVVTGGPAYEGDPGCGAVIDVNSQTHWFDLDSISNPQKMTVYSENPRACEVNTTSCFCNAQMDLTVLTLDELSYFTEDEEEEHATTLLKYIENNAGMKNIEPKFRLGKLNLNFTDSTAIGYCGERPGNNRIGFFSGAIVNDYVKDYGLDEEPSQLCAFSDNAKWWERK